MPSEPPRDWQRSSLLGRWSGAYFSEGIPPEVRACGVRTVLERVDDGNDLEDDRVDLFEPMIRGTTLSAASYPTN